MWATWPASTKCPSSCAAPSPTGVLLVPACRRRCRVALLSGHQQVIRAVQGCLVQDCCACLTCSTPISAPVPPANTSIHSLPLYFESSVPAAAPTIWRWPRLERRLNCYSQDRLLASAAHDHVKVSVLCREYLAALLGYLESFHQRTQPLTSLDKVGLSDAIESAVQLRWCWPHKTLVCTWLYQRHLLQQLDHNATGAAAVWASMKHALRCAEAACSG